jgi:hypothetical protein
VSTTKGELVSQEQVAVVIRDGITRTLAVVGLAGVALIHLLDAPGKFGETPYMGWLYVALIAGCIGAAAALIRSGSPRTWLAAALLPVGPLVGYTLTRTVGLPQATDDIGNWAEPLGLASLFVEVGLVTLCCFVFTSFSGASRLSIGREVASVAA